MCQKFIGETNRRHENEDIRFSFNVSIIELNFKIKFDK